MWLRVLSLRCIASVMAMILAAVGANLVGIGLFLVVRPFSRAIYRRLAAQYVATMWIDAMSLLLPSTTICISGDSDMPDGVSTGIVVANHQYEGDWWFMMLVARFLGLTGNVKVMVPEELRHWPVVGWFLQLVEYPFTSSSSWAKSRADLFTLLRSYTADAFPVLLFLFPEGARIDSDIREKSVGFAQKENRPQLVHLVLPRTQGFNACLEALRESQPVVYDMTMALPGSTDVMLCAVKGGLETFLRFFKGQGPREVHIRLKRYSMEEVLADPHWLDNRWAEKDRVLAHFGRTQQFPFINGTRSVVGTGGGGKASGGFPSQLRVFNSRTFKAEASTMALIRLCLTPLSLPFLLLMALPAISLFLWVTFIRYVLTVMYDLLLRVLGQSPSGRDVQYTGSGGAINRTPDLANTSQPATPFLPQTPFTSPLIGSFDLVHAPPRRNCTSNPAGEVTTNPHAFKRIRSFGDVVPLSLDAAAAASSLVPPLPRVLANQPVNPNRPPCVLRPADMITGNLPNKAAATTPTATSLSCFPANSRLPLAPTNSDHPSMDGPLLSPQPHQQQAQQPTSPPPSPGEEGATDGGGEVFIAEPLHGDPSQSSPSSFFALDFKPPDLVGASVIDDKKTR